MSLRQLLNVTYAWMLEGREHHRDTVDRWLAGKPLVPRQDDIRELAALAEMRVV